MTTQTPTLTLARADLIETCWFCHGARLVYNPVHHSFGPEQLQAMTQEEYRRFEEEYGPEEVPCEECEGRGEVLTEAGRAVADVVRWLQR